MAKRRIRVDGSEDTYFNGMECGKYNWSDSITEQWLQGKDIAGEEWWAGVENHFYEIPYGLFDVISRKDKYKMWEDEE